MVFKSSGSMVYKLFSLWKYSLVAKSIKDKYWINISMKLFFLFSKKKVRDNYFNRLNVEC